MVPMRRIGTLVTGALLLALAGCKERDVPWRQLPYTYGIEGAPTPPASAFDDERGGVLSRDRVDATKSGWAADLLGHVPYALLMAAALALGFFHRRRAELEKGVDPRAPLRDGDGAVTGTVEAPPGWQGPVVRLDIHQLGREWQHKGAWNHNWTETSRTLHTRPFTIVRDDGQRVQVEPPQEIALHDDHGRIVRHDYARRTRFAEVLAGDRVTVVGGITGAGQGAALGAYRASGNGPVVRAPSVGKMVVSTEAPGATSSARMRFHFKWLVGLGVVVGFLAGVVMPEYELLSLTGRTEQVTPTHVRSWRVWHKPRHGSGYWVNHYAVKGVYRRDGVEQVVDDEVGPDVYDCVEGGACTRVPFTVSSVAPTWHQFGTAPMLTVGRNVIMGLFLLVIAIAYPVSAFSTRPWYMKRKVVDGGRGQLSASQP